MPPLKRRWRSTPTTQDRAGELRRAMTPAERRLWQHLRNNQVEGAHFRRQAPVGAYIVDFVCPVAKLVVEVDGDSHVTQPEYDVARTNWLAQQKGYRVIRFTNREVINNLEAVVEAIRAAIKQEA